MALCPKCQEYNFQPPLEATEEDDLCLLHSRCNNCCRDDAFDYLLNEKLKRQDYNFAGVFFHTQFSFENLAFTGKINFLESEFSKDANFVGTTFSGNANFEGARFSQEANFDEATFLGDADFNRSTFSAKANFFGTNLSGDANFSDATFTGHACFLKAIFSGDANFRNAKFSKYAEFGSTFSGIAIFSFAKFSAVADFIEAIFQEVADFERTRFTGDALFTGTTFVTSAFFNTASLQEKARMIFYEINPVVREKTEKSGQYQPIMGDFRNMEMELGTSVIFKECNLNRCSFAESDLTFIEFDRVTWASQWGRTAIYDELIWRERKEGSPEALERLYRQLKSNYEENKDSIRVGDFHYGEMEMHRMGSPWRRRFPLSWYNLYWALNGYGERPLRAIVWLAVFFFFFTFILYFSGLTVASCSNPASISEASRLVIEKATLQRPEWAKPVSELGQWIANSIVIVIPGQLALFFLALRNRLGRRR